MKIFLKLLLSCLFIFTLVFVSSCSGAGTYQRSIYDDAAKIAATGDSYTYNSKTGSVQSDRLSYEIKGFYGKETVWEIDADEKCEIDLNVSADIKSGKFKLCLVGSDNAVATIFEGSQDEVCTITLTAGKNRIIMVGSKAGCSVSVQLPADIADKPVTVKPIEN